MTELVVVDGVFRYDTEDSGVMDILWIESWGGVGYVS